MQIQILTQIQIHTQNQNTHTNTNTNQIQIQIPRLLKCTRMLDTTRLLLHSIYTTHKCRANNKSKYRYTQSKNADYKTWHHKEYMIQGENELQLSSVDEFQNPKAILFVLCALPWCPTFSSFTPSLALQSLFFFQPQTYFWKLRMTFKILFQLLHHLLLTASAVHNTKPSPTFPLSLYL